MEKAAPSPQYDTLLQDAFLLMKLVVFLLYTWLCSLLNLHSPRGMRGKNLHSQPLSSSVYFCPLITRLQALRQLCFVLFFCCTNASARAPATHLGSCTGRRRPAWHCTGANWSGCAGPGRHTRCLGRWGCGVAGPLRPPARRSRSPIAACRQI